MADLSVLVRTISMDLQASTERHGLLATLSALFFEPGFACIFFYRVAVFFYSNGFGRLGKFLWRRHSVRYGCYLHLHADIAGGLRLPHPVGVVVGEGVKISEWVTLYQGVTLGQGSTKMRYPKVGDRATIFANAVVFGDVRVGSRAVIGAGSVVNRHVPDGDVVAGSPAKSICHSKKTHLEAAPK